MLREEWLGFKEGRWVNEINVRSFIHKNYVPYYGSEAFLEGPTEATLALWEQVSALRREEIERGGALDMDTKVVSTITSHAPGYLDKEKSAFYLEEAYISTVRTAEKIAELLRAGGTKADAIELFKDEYYHGNVKEMYPVDAMELNTGIMIGVIEKELL